MAKKRKASRRDAEPDGPKELDPSDARLGPVSTYEDVANSEDEFFINRDALMLDDGPESKRRRKAARDEEDLEFSDAEILGNDDDDDDDDDEEEDEEEDRRPPPSKSKKGAKKGFSDDEEGGKDADGDGEDSGWWGSSKKEYYDADNIETEADALEEEAEAKRLQKKKLAKMAEEDFIFDGDEWLAGDKGDEEAEAEADAAETITEVLKEIEITDDMGTEERSKLLAARYPEFDYLVRDFQELQPLLGDLKAEAEAGEGMNGSSDASLATIKYWILGCYVASLASYFAILTSPARDAAKEPKSIDPTELRDHDVMETLVRCRDAWGRIKSMKSTASADPALTTMDVDSIPPLSMDDAAEGQSTEIVKKKTKAKARKDKEKKSRKLEKAAAIEEMVADLYDMPLSSKSKAKVESKATATATKTTTASAADDGNSDFGEEDTLDARTAADKATRKKSLKFYTSQIVQKASRRAGAGRDAGGDMDIPHRERLRDRQARLLAEAEKRGKQGSKGGADLGDDDDDADGNDAKAARALRDEEDEYYDMVAHKAKAKKDDKAARYAAYAAASKADRVVETEEVGEDGKRKINYTIEKNKGLAPKRNKDARNPRVKRRKQFEAKQKKLKSMKPVWQGGEPKGGYKGETSGINAAVVKSTRL